MSTVSHPKPQDNNVFLYFQIVHLHNINTTSQTFTAKFYLTATWVQDVTKLHFPADVAGHDFQINSDGSKWPNAIYRPSLSFDNAVGASHSQGLLSEQFLSISKWRQPSEKSAKENTAEKSSKDAVLEWRASGSATFAFDAQIQNFPFDIQLLKVTIASLDNQVRLRDDNRDNVQSVIRKDYFFDPEFDLAKDIMEKDVDFDYGSSSSEARGLRLLAKEDVFVINPTASAKSRQFSTLSYIVPVRRKGTTVTTTNENRNNIVLLPISISLTSLLALATFVYVPESSSTSTSDKLQLLTMIALLFTAVTFVFGQTSSSTTSLSSIRSFSGHILFSTIYVLSTLVLLVLSTAICSNEFDMTESDGGMNMNMTIYCTSTDSGTTIQDLIYILAWIGWNAWFYIDLYVLKRKREKKRIETMLRIANDFYYQQQNEHSNVYKVLPLYGAV